LKEGSNELWCEYSRSPQRPAGRRQQAFDKSEGCVYTARRHLATRLAGSVGPSFVENISVVPDPDHDRVLIEATVNGRRRLIAKTLRRGLCRRQAVVPIRSSAPGAINGWCSTERKEALGAGSPYLYD